MQNPMVDPILYAKSDGRPCFIYLDDGDRVAWLEALANVCERFNWVVHAYCEMSNHYHLLVETVDGNLSRGMRQLNGHYTQRFNRKHRMAGHLFQGRYKAFLIQKENYLVGVDAIRGAEPGSCRHGRAAGGLAVEQLPGGCRHVRKPRSGWIQTGC